MSRLRSAARAARLGAERARFAVWAKRLDTALRRAGGRLVLDAPHGAHFYELPSLEIHPYGGEAGTLTLRVGGHVMLGRGLILEVWAGAENTVELGDRATFRAGVRVQMRGGAVRLGADARIRDYSLLEASGGEIVLGDSVQFGAQVCLHATERIALGEHVTVGERTSMFDSDHRHDGSDAPVVDQPVKITPRRDRREHVHRRQLARAARRDRRAQLHVRGREHRARRRLRGRLPVRRDAPAGRASAPAACAGRTRQSIGCMA